MNIKIDDKVLYLYKSKEGGYYFEIRKKFQIPEDLNGKNRLRFRRDILEENLIHYVVGAEYFYENLDSEQKDGEKNKLKVTHIGSPYIKEEDDNDEDEIYTRFQRVYVIL